MIRFENIRALAALSSLIALAATPVGACTPASREDSVEPRVELVDESRQGLSTGLMKWVNGTYTGCTSRSGSWSAHVGADASVMTNAALSVVKDDTACVLALTGIEADATYAGAPSITLGTSYAGSASSFATVVDGGAGPLAFYANSTLDSVSFASHFTMTILFSANVASTSPSPDAGYATVSYSVTDSLVVPPDYTTDFSGVVLSASSEKVVSSATGNVTLSASGQTGELYVVSTDQSLGSTFEQVDEAYAQGTKYAVAASIEISAFTLVGQTLPKKRNLVISHAVDGVNAYQVIRITFNDP
jgi:hypothetical protein